MSHNIAIGGLRRPARRSTSSIACLAFVVMLGLAFWAGVLGIGQFLLRIGVLPL